MVTIRCAGCSSQFVPTRPTQRTCSPTCRQRAWRRRHRGLPPQPRDHCASCGQPLLGSNSPMRRYCDNRCRVRAYRERLASRRATA